MSCPRNAPTLWWTPRVYVTDALAGVHMLVRSFAVVTACLVAVSCGGGGGGSTGPSTLSVNVSVSPIPSGTSVQAIATLTDASGRTSPATNVTWSSSDHNVASITSTGLVTAAKKGTTTISAVSGTLVGQVNVAVVPGAPASIAIVSGNGQSGAKGSTLADPLCTAVLDAAGNWITGITVNYVVTTGGGALQAPTSPATDVSGIAISGHWTLGPSAGQQSVTATASVGSVTFTANSQ